MNKKAFLLVDSLVCLIITVCISALCIYTFNQVDSYHDSYKLYYEDINDDYSNIYHRRHNHSFFQLKQQFHLLKNLVY